MSLFESLGLNYSATVMNRQSSNRDSEESARPARRSISTLGSPVLPGRETFIPALYRAWRRSSVGGIYVGYLYNIVYLYKAVINNIDYF